MASHPSRSLDGAPRAVMELTPKSFGLATRHPRAMEKWKAKNAYHFPTAPVTTTSYTRSQTKTENLQLWLDEKKGAGQWEPNDQSLPNFGSDSHQFPFPCRPF